MTTRREPLVAAGCLALLLMAACGGDTSDDTSSGEAAPATAPADSGGEIDSTGDVEDSGSVEGAPDEGVDSGGEGDGSGGDGGGAAPDVLDGPTLEPSATISYGPSQSPSGDQLAMSPSGQHVAVSWINVDSGEQQLDVFDTTTGELTASGEVELSGDMYWSADDQIVVIDRLGAVGLIDPATAMRAGELIAFEPFSCSGSNGRFFDRDDGAFYGEANTNGERIVCRLDISDGTVASYSENGGATNLVVAVDGDTAYAITADDDLNVTLLTLDSMTMTVRESTPVDDPRTVLAATAAGSIRAQTDGFEYEIQPAGVVVPRFSFVMPSYSGGHYAAPWDRGTVIIDAATADVVGRIGTFLALNRYDWSSDDAVFGIISDDGPIEIYRLG